MPLASWAEVDTGWFDFSKRGGLASGPASNSNSAKSRRALELESDWRAWLETFFPEYVSRGFAKHHREYWQWLWRIEPDSDPPPFVGVWPRGGGKSSSVELGCAALGLRGKRRYILYVRDTQDRADDSVQNIAALLEEAGMERRVNKYGQSKGWRRNRIRTATGGTVDALGLDVAGRGVKLENLRPDVIVFDDIDARHDSERTTAKKLATITESLLPAGTDNVAVVMIQNLIIPDGVFAMLADERADFLSGRIVSGPHPAVMDAEITEGEWPDGRPRHLVSGEPSWEGQDLSACQRLLDRIGLSSFMRECQHEVSVEAGSLVYERYADALRLGDSVAPNREAAQFIGIDPGFSQRCAMLAVQERADRVEMWREWSFVRCDDDHIASVCAEHCLDWDVSTVFHDAESPELGAAIRKHLRRLTDERDGYDEPVRAEVVSIPFNKYKRLSIKATRWLMRLGSLAWGAKTSEQHEPDGDDHRIWEVPGVFRSEIKKYQLVPGKEDEAVKERDHGPDAFHAYAAKHIPEFLSNTDGE